MQVHSAAVPRPPKKPKKGELHRVHIILPAETVALIDRLAEGMNPGPGRIGPVTRTEAIRRLIEEGLEKHRGLLK